MKLEEKRQTIETPQLDTPRTNFRLNRFVIPTANFEFVGHLAANKCSSTKISQ